MSGEDNKTKSANKKSFKEKLNGVWASIKNYIKTRWEEEDFFSESDIRGFKTLFGGLLEFLFWILGAVIIAGLPNIIEFLFFFIRGFDSNYIWNNLLDKVGLSINLTLATVAITFSNIYNDFKSHINNSTKLAGYDKFVLSVTLFNFVLLIGSLVFSVIITIINLEPSLTFKTSHNLNLLFISSSLLVFSVVLKFLSDLVLAFRDVHNTINGFFVLLSLATLYYILEKNKIDSFEKLLSFEAPENSFDHIAGSLAILILVIIIFSFSVKKKSPDSEDK